MIRGRCSRNFGDLTREFVANNALSRRKQGFESPRERHVIASTVAIADFFAVFV